MGVAYETVSGDVRIDAAETNSPEDAKDFAALIIREADKALKNSKGIAAVVEGTFSGTIYLVQNFRKVKDGRIEGVYTILKRENKAPGVPSEGHNTKSVKILYQVK